MTKIQRQQQQYSAILEQFAAFNNSPKRQQDTFTLFMSILGYFAITEEVTADHLMFGTFYVQVKALVQGKAKRLNFFIPCTGDMIYRYTEEKEQLKIFLNPRDIVTDEQRAISAVQSTNWLALSPAS
jgi:hypothetical protein